MTTIRVSLTEPEAEALLAFIPGTDGNGQRLHPFDPVALLSGRSKLIGKLLNDPGYVPPAHRKVSA